MTKTAIIVIWAVGLVALAFMLSGCEYLSDDDTAQADVGIQFRVICTGDCEVWFDGERMDSKTSEFENMEVTRP